MEVKEIECKSCMSKSDLADYAINPYTGCQHGCKYCYADFMRKYQNIEAEWGSFVFAKTNCAEVLKKELEKNKSGSIWMGSVTDCYMPLEAKFKLTRKILESIVPFKNKFTTMILTKSSLVRRDFDLLKELNVDLGLSINNTDENVSRIIEPFASSPNERIKVLKEAKEKGIKIFGFISPVLPGLTNLDELFKELSFCEYVFIELLNTKKYILDRLMPVIQKEFPDKVKDFEFAIEHQKEYYEKIRNEVELLSKKYNLKVMDVIVH